MGSNIALFYPNISVAHASISNTFAPLGAPFTHAIRLIHFINATDGDVMISTDGVNDMVAIIADSFALYDITSDQDVNDSFRIAKGTQLYIRYLTAPSKETFYVNAIYGKGE